MPPRIVQMAVMRTLWLAKTSVVTYPLITATIVTMVVVFLCNCYAVPRTDPCAQMVVIWLIVINVIIFSQKNRIHTDGLAPIAPRSVFSKHLDVMGYMIVRMAAMKVIVR